MSRRPMFRMQAARAATEGERYGNVLRTGAVLAAACAAAQMAWPARAAGPAPASTALPAVDVLGARSPAASLDEPVATGSRLGLTARETPASVETVTREQIEQRGDETVADAVVRAAGFSAMRHPGNGGTALAARGFTDHASIAQLYDGLRPVGNVGITFPTDTWSVDRVEVLRGPASVVYGNGAIGGVVNVVPKQPVRGPVANALQLGVGTDGQRQFGLGSGGRIDDVFSYRVDLSEVRDDGERPLGDSRNRAASFALRADLSPRLNATLSHARGDQRPERYFGTPLVDGAIVPALADRNYNVADSAIRYRDTWTRLDLHWQPADDVRVRNQLYRIDSDRRWRNVERYAWLPARGLIERSDYTAIRHDQGQVGNLTDLSVDGTVFGLRNTASLGAEFNRNHFTHTNNSPYGSTSLVDPYAPVPGGFIDTVPARPRYRSEAEQYAVFAEDRLMLREDWTVIGGLRWDHVDFSRRDLVAGGETDRTFANVGWRLGTVYDLTPATALYAQYARAADPVSSLMFLSPANAVYDLARGRQAEVGVKQAFWDGRGELTLAAYQIVKHGLLTRDPANPDTRIQVGQQSSRGVEATLGLAFAPGWRVDANVSALRARYDDFQELSGGALVSRDGNVPTDVPQRLANLWLTWDATARWQASLGARFVGARYADSANTLRMAGYVVADAALRWSPRKDTRVTVRGRNLFDKRYAETAYYNTTQWLIGEGRGVSVTLDYDF